MSATLVDAGGSRGLRLLQGVGVVLACVVLFLFFCLVRFPFESFRAPLVARLAQATGAAVALQEFGGGPSLGLVALRAEGVRLAWPDGRAVVLDRASVRPAWSLSWLRGEPAFHADLLAPAGRVAGTVWPAGPEPGFDGSVDELALDAVAAMLGRADAFPVAGRAAGDVRVFRGAGGLRGELDVEARDGSLAPPGLPLAVPFATLALDARFDPAEGIAIEALELEGPLLSGGARGTIGPGPRLDASPLELEVTLQKLDPGIAQTIGSLGLGQPALGAPIRLGGTLADPIVR